MKFSQKDLDQIESLAGIYATVSDMAIILDVPVEQLRFEISQKDSEVSRAYYRGKTLAKVQLHKQEMDLARIGSPLALENMRRSLVDMEDDE